MKIRTGFVSNSSSSSFVVAGKCGSQPKIRVTLEIDVEKLVDYELSSDEELDEYFEYNYGDNWRKYQEYLSDYTKMLKLIGAGNVIYVCRVSNDDDDALSNYLYAIDGPRGEQLINCSLVDVS